MHILGGIKLMCRPIYGRLRRRLCLKTVTQVALLLAAGLGGFFACEWSQKVLYTPSRDTFCRTQEFGHSHLPSAHTLLPPPEDTPYREPDSIDTFAHYKYRNHSDCRLSSQDLHIPFSPLCSTRHELLSAISGGGRVGFDAPFIPRGCDFRWYTTEEVCEIISRFEKVIVIGDSMMRHVIGAINVLLRKDLGYGAVTNWNFNEEEMYVKIKHTHLFMEPRLTYRRQKCFCTHQMDVKACSVQGIYTTSSVLEHDPHSLACQQPIDLVIELMLRFPLDPIEVERFRALLSPAKPKKPYAFIFGHGLWNDLDLQATLNWLDGINEHALKSAPYLSESLWPRLVVTPNAAGILKPDQWVLTQGDKALQMFEHSVREEAAIRNIDHFGTWNMSVQTHKYDGGHLDLRGNLIKAQGIINWLAMVDAHSW